MKKIVAAIKQKKLFFVAAFAVFVTASAFFMSIASWPALYYDKIILLAPELTWETIAYWLAYSALAAVALTLLAAKYQRLKRTGFLEGTTGFLGMAAGTLVSACPICAPLIVTIIGIPLSTAALPFQGWEVRLASIVLLSLSAYVAAKSIEGGEACLSKPPRNA